MKLFLATVMSALVLSACTTMDYRVKLGELQLMANNYQGACFTHNSSVTPTPKHKELCQRYGIEFENAYQELAKNGLDNQEFFYLQSLHAKHRQKVYDNY